MAVLFLDEKCLIFIDDFLSRTLKRSMLISGTSSTIYSRWCLLGPIKLNGTVALNDDEEMIQIKIHSLKEFPLTFNSLQLFLEDLRRARTLPPEEYNIQIK